MKRYKNLIEVIKDYQKNNLKEKETFIFKNNFYQVKKTQKTGLEGVGFLTNHNIIKV